MSRPLRVMVASVGIAGHALPAIALARELRSRGHDVLVKTADRWRPVVEAEGLRFGGGERDIVPSDEGAGGDGHAALADTVRALLPALRELRPDIVVSDGLTLSPALAAEVDGLPHATLHPEIFPLQGRGLPPLPSGLFPPRTALGSAAWRAAGPLLRTRLPGTRWLRGARPSLNETRARLGLPPVNGLHRPVTEGLHLVATLPQLEYPRRWPQHVHVTGPMFLDLPDTETEIPDGRGPLVLVAPSTVKDPERRLVRVALEALADEPVRVLVTMSGTGGAPTGSVPANATLVDWVSYPHVMPAASLVVCGGNHGTLAQALAEGAPVLVSPALEDDAEHGARVAWAGAGLMLPRRLLTPRLLRVAVGRGLREPRFAARAAEIASWSRANDGAAAGATLIERYMAA